MRDGGLGPSSIEPRTEAQLSPSSTARAAPRRALRIARPEGRGPSAARRLWAHGGNGLVAPPSNADINAREVRRKQRLIAEQSKIGIRRRRGVEYPGGCDPQDSPERPERTAGLICRGGAAPFGARASVG